MIPGKTLNGSRQSTGPGRDIAFYDEGGKDYARRAVYVETMDPPQRNEGGTGLLETWHLIRSHLALIAIVGILGAVGGGIFTLYQTPLFRAKSTIEVQPPAANAMGFATAPAAEAENAENYVRTQTKILQSRTLEGRVIDKLKATNHLSSYSPPDKLARVRKFLKLPAKVVGAGQSMPGFDFKVAYDTTQIIELSVDSPDPKFAADYLNTMADEFTQLQLEMRWESSKRTTAWLNDQLEEMRRKLENGESKLRAYALSAGIMITDGKDAIPEDKLKEIQHELSTATGARIHAQSVYEVAGKSASQDSIPQVNDNERLGGYQIELAKLRQQMAELRSVYTDEHPQVLRVKAQINDLETTLKREQNSLITRIRNDFLTAQRREDLLMETYAGQARIVSDHAAQYTLYDIIKREVDTDRDLYSALLLKVRESSVASAIGANNVRVVDRASVPLSPFRPSMSMNVAGGLLAALFLGVGLVIIGDQVNRSLKSPGETALHLRVPELGVIPAYEATDEVLQALPVPMLLGGLESNGKKPPEQVELAMRNDAQSLVAESYRNLLTSILLSDSSQQRPRVIVVTAAGRQAGKSSSVSNLALALAEIGQKVLVIDADMRRPRQHLIFDTPNSWGLSDLLRERTSLKDCPLEAIARPIEFNALYLLPAGPACPNISSLLYSNRVSELLQRVRGEFDTILIDTPPVLMVSDARVVGRMADAAILVIRAGETTRDLAFHAKQRLVDDGIVVLGTILNGWRLKNKTRYTNYNFEGQAETRGV